MSLRRPLLNLIVRMTEKRFLARVRDPEEARQGFERKARWLFRPPRGTVHRRQCVGSVPALCLPAAGRGTILYLHGGAYVFGSARTHLGMVARLSQLSGLAACLPDYRLAPEHPFPAALTDAMSVYRELAAQGPVYLGGDSAGGGLALALLAEIARLGLTPPVLTFALSPYTDQTLSGEALRRNARSEVLLPVARMEELRDMYLQGADPADPRASPLFGVYSGMGPVFLAASDSEILEDDAWRMQDRLIAQQVEVHAIRGHGLPHVWPYFWRYLPEGDRDLRRLAAVMRALATR